MVFIFLISLSNSRIFNASYLGSRAGWFQILNTQYICIFCPDLSYFSYFQNGDGSHFYLEVRIFPHHESIGLMLNIVESDIIFIVIACLATYFFRGEDSLTFKKKTICFAKTSGI